MHVISNSVKLAAFKLRYQEGVRGIRGFFKYRVLALGGIPKI